MSNRISKDTIINQNLFSIATAEVILLGIGISLGVAGSISDRSFFVRISLRMNYSVETSFILELFYIHNKESNKVLKV